MSYRGGPQQSNGEEGRPAQYAQTMRMYLATVGSRGDFEPFRALAIAAANAGHEVYFAHTADFTVEDHVGYSSLVLPGSFEDLLSEGFSLMKSLAQYRDVIEPMLQGIYSTSTSQILSLKPDVVVYHPKVVTAAPAAQAVGALSIRVELVPTLTPTRETPAAGLPLRLPKALNRATYAVVSAGLSAFGNPAKKAAKQLQVSGFEPELTLCPVTAAVFPQPKDWPSNAWVTGPWLSSNPAKSDAELDDFIGRAPTIYVGFGSMNDGRTSSLTRAKTILEASRQLGYQTLFVTGWGGVQVTDADASAPDVLVRQSVHHESVFPRVAVAIHHGGAGTTQAALRAGTPSVIRPFLADQPWWATRLHSKGLGPRAVAKRERNSEAIAKALRDAVACQPQVASAATEMAEENGVVTSLRIIETAVTGSRRA